MELRMKNFNIMGVHWKIQFLWGGGGGGGGGYKKPIYRGDLPEKEGAWTVCRFKGDLAEIEGVVFLRGGLIPQCTL